MRKQSWRAALLASTAAATLGATAAAAQDAAPAAAAEGSVEAVVVTGSRLQASGFTAPTPVTVVGNAAIESRAKVNIADALNEIPSFQASSGPGQATRNLTGTLGFSTIDLRGLGAARTLVLVDGRRFVPIAPSGVVDAAAIPTSLVDRVEVVTGGASAQYGSDAVAGVVNFILRDRLEGVRADAQTGTSEHGGNQEWAANIAVGHGFLDGRLHVIAGADWAKDLGISSQYKRDWGALEPGYAGLTATRPAGVPANVLGYGEHFSNMTYGGIIVSGPLKGTAFAPGGVPYQFNYGALTGGNLMLGGDNYGVSDSSVRDLVHPTERMSSLARVNFDVTPSTTLYAEFGYVRERVDTKGPYLRTPDNVTIFRNNPFLPAATAAAMDMAGISSFGLGRYSTEMGQARNESINTVTRGVIGAKGTLFGNWKWDIYGESGQTLTHSDYYNFSSTRFYQALYAVTGADGKPACGPITTNPYYLSKDVNRKQQILNTISQTACVPFNPFGVGAPSQAALAYVQTHFDQRILTVQNAAEASASGSPFATWAGPVSVAFGGAARRDGGKQDADTCGINACNDGVNFTPLDGSQSVYEFFGETGVPLLKDSSFGRSLDFNAAVRQTHYSLSGWATTWKVGGVYEPTNWLRIRATESRDIRAPRITELFQPGAANGLNITNPLNGISASVKVLNNGNPDLKPEVANTFTGGFVITPKWGWLDGLRVSMDYYHIVVNGAIGTVSGTDIVNRYFNLHLNEYGQYISFDSSAIGFSTITTKFLNLDQVLADGVDMEASYRVPIDQLNVPGRFNISALVTWANRLATIDQLGTKTQVTNRVGVAQGGGGPIPRWRSNVSFDYALGKFATTLQARAFSGFLLMPTLIGPDNPLYSPTLQNSVNDNKGPGGIYWSLSARYDIIRKGDQQLQVFGVIDNLLDKDPPINGFPMSSNGGIPYDFIGRDFKIGVRLVM